MVENIKEKIVIEYLLLLNKNNINYCVLRDSNQLYSGVDHDVDLYVSPKSFKTFKRLILDFFNTENIKIVKLMEKYDFKSFIIEFEIEGSFDFLKIDVWTRFQWRGMLWLNNNDVENNIIYQNDIRILSPEMALVIRMLKDLIFTSKLPDRSLNRVNDEFQYLVENNLLMEFKKLFCNEKIADNFVEALLHKQNNLLSTKAKKIRWSQIYCGLIAKAKIFHNITCILFFIIDQIKSLFNGPGKMIVLMGPDGSGKSSLANKVKDDYGNKIFNGCDIEYSRPGILPPLNTIFSKIKGRSNPAKVYDLNTNDKVSGLKGSLQIFYYTLDFLLGSILLKLKISRGKLIIYDRYFYDYIIQSYWDDVKISIKYMCLKFVVSPDINIFLNASSKTIRERKPELKKEVIEDQQNRITNLYLKNNIVTVETDSDISSSANIIFHLIFENSYNKGKK